MEVRVVILMCIFKIPHHRALFTGIVDAERYGINSEEIMEHLVECSEGYFHQDGATALSPEVARKDGNNFFWIRLFRREFWIPTSSDLMLPDFILLPYLKHRAY